MVKAEEPNGRIFFRDLLTFTRTSDTLEVFKEMKKVFPDARLTLVPHQVSRSCGFALQFPSGDLKEHCDFFGSVQPEASMHRMTMQTDEKGMNHVMSVREISLDEERV